MTFRWERDWSSKESEYWIGFLPDDPAAKTYPAMLAAAFVTRTSEGKFDARLRANDFGTRHELGEYDTFEDATKICEVTWALDGYTLQY